VKGGLVKPAEVPPQYRAAETLERFLGDPDNPESPVSFASALRRDEAEIYPDSEHALLHHSGLSEAFIPPECGGNFRSFEEMLAMLRSLSRRDVTLAETFVITFVGALPVWIAGSHQQKAWLANVIRSGNKVSFALTERSHGGDLLANEMEAVEDGVRLLISGEKWLIGNVNRAQAVALFARTRPAGGPRGFTLLLVDKTSLEPSRFTYLPEVPTVGLRGAGLGGIAFDRCPVSECSRIGVPGSGLELTLQCLQVTRILCTGLSLGGADTALRLATDFAVTRTLYGRNAFAIPYVKALLTTAFLDLTICDAVAIAGVRALQVCTGQISVWSAITKYFVPLRIEALIRDLSVVLGARFFLRSGHPWSMFQKMARDVSIVSVFEGSTVIQLHALGIQLDRILGNARTPEGELRERIRALFSLSAPVPEFNPALLDLLSRDGDDAVTGIPLLTAALRDSGSSEALCAAAGTVMANHRKLTEEVRGDPAVPADSPQAFQRAARYVRLHAAACCIGFWIHNRGTWGGCPEDEDWLLNCLERIGTHFEVPIESAYLERELLARHACGHLLSLAPFALAGGATAGQHA
jgi:alkylation response protein AidB-like acyl-CoA dehydrogenase